ncbi:very long chain fatty acid elongase 4-like [Zophobas morio]|uniref:very long chain fatty acid elongase 4-like n=1 Tax=Zophobas morio TaxID=2755281 RepID=UPI0030834429
MSTFWLLPSPPQFFALITSYVVILIVGPLLMKKRQPFDLRSVLVVYNCSQVFLNGGLMLLGIPVAHRVTIFCNPDHDSNSHENAIIAKLYLNYVYLKMYDLLDTVFFILRKKHAQISFLHVYHHIMILVVGWMGTKYYPPATYPGGPCLLFGLVNCFVHMFMYYYYLRSVTRGPNLNSMTWKKYVTVLQLVQHYVMLLLTCVALMTEECPYPKYIVFAAMLGFFTMVYLFSQFYWKTYIRRKDKLANGKAVH